jgi:hypothetical protein
MNISTRRGILATCSTFLLTAAAVVPAAARPDGGPLRQPAAESFQVPFIHCPLERVGTQLVRCDNLTGAGVVAAPWVPERTSGTHVIVDQHLGAASERWDR